MTDTTFVQVILGFHAGLLATLSFTDLDISILAWIALADAVVFVVFVVRDTFVELYEP